MSSDVGIFEIGSSATPFANVSHRGGSFITKNFSKSNFIISGNIVSWLALANTRYVILNTNNMNNRALLNSSFILSIKN